MGGGSWVYHAAQEAEATQIKEDVLRQCWTRDGYNQWINANLLLSSVRADMEELKASAQASNSSQASQVTPRLACKSSPHSPSLLFFRQAAGDPETPIWPS